MATEEETEKALEHVEDSDNEVLKDDDVLRALAAECISEGGMNPDDMKNYLNTIGKGHLYNEAEELVESSEEDDEDSEDENEDDDGGYDEDPEDDEDDEE